MTTETRSLSPRVRETLRALVETCRQKGVRMTLIRRLVCRQLAELEGPPDVLMVHARIAELDPAVSIAKVHQCLREMADAGVVPHSFPALCGSRLEQRRDSDRDYLTNLQAGRAIAFCDQAITREIEAAAARLGYVLKGWRLELFGEPTDVTLTAHLNPD